MHLRRPLVFMDVETTGLDIEHDRIIELALLRVEPPELTLEGVRRFRRLVNPGQPLPAGVTELTGITELDLAAAPPFEDLADTVEAWIGDADLAGYNIVAFDLPILHQEFRRIGRVLPGPEDRAILDALEIWRRMEPRTLENAYRYFVGGELTRAHRAIGDAEATAEILLAQTARYGLKGHPREIVQRMRHPYLDSRRRFRKEGSDVVLCFGKYRDYSLRQVEETDPEYLSWLLEHLDPEAVALLRQYLPG